jgi:glyoxylase-like metal-dependent hydrolase (beta-lactamase superfamily II)
MGKLTRLAQDLIEGAIEPEEVSPFAPRMELDEVAEGVAFVSSFANSTAIETARGLVLVDTGSFLLSGQVHASFRLWRPDARAHAAVFTHGHVDHCFGMDRWEAEADARGWARPTVFAHELVPARFDRYQRTRGWNGCINGRQFSAKVQWPERFRDPDVTYASRMALDVGGERIDLVHARGETDDHTWVWVPSKKLLCTGDLFLWVCPNAGNPQKVQRYPLDWARALREMAALEPEILCPGHGLPIAGAERVRTALIDTAELLESLHDQTVALMNEGARLADVLATVKAPAHLLEKPYLRPVYDEPSFIVRNVWRLYGGWWDGSPSSLQPAHPRALARELAALCVPSGERRASVDAGARVLADRALALSEAGEHALASHLAEMAAEAAPGDAGIWGVRRTVFTRRAGAAGSLMAQGIYRFAAGEEPGAGAAIEEG